MVYGNRIPYEYFLTCGKGESNNGSEELPYETGSYDEALHNAGIGTVNIIKYSSILPPQSKQISKKEGLTRLHWGEVLECIQAISNGSKGMFISSAIMTVTIHLPNKYLGGFVCEYAGFGTKEESQESLLKSIKGMINRRGYGKFKDLKLFKDNVSNSGVTVHPGKHFIYDSMTVKKQHGSVVTSMCFVSFLHPKK